MLHAQAVKAAESKGVIIENTAADGNDAKTAVFHSAGEHMIVARAKADGEKIDKKTAVEGIREYVKVFCGEDVSKGLKDDEFFELPSSESEAEAGAEGSSGGTDAEDEEVSESIPSFSMFLSESTGINVIAEADGDEDDGDEAGDEEDGDEAGNAET